MMNKVDELMEWVWRDNEYDTCCVFCWEGDYTTEPVEVEKDEDTRVN